MGTPIRQKSFGIAELAAGLFWRVDERILMGWIYYDESGEYDSKGNLLNMTIGGCAATVDRWQAFDTEWKKVLEDEDIPCFHMTDFEAWVPPFDFKLPDGNRDKERHNRILNRLLDIMLAHIEGFHGYGAVSQFNPGISLSGPMTHWALMHDCVNGAMKNAVLAISDQYSDPLSLVFAKQKHIPEQLIRRYLEVYTWGPTEGRIKSLTTASPKDITALQAADLFAYEMARAQRADRPERYPFSRLVAGAKAKGLRMTVYWGPISSVTRVISPVRASSGGQPF